MTVSKFVSLLAWLSYFATFWLIVLNIRSGWEITVAMVLFALMGIVAGMNQGAAERYRKGRGDG